MTGSIDRSAKENIPADNKDNHLHLRKGVLSLVLVAAIVFSAAFIAINATDNSEAVNTHGVESTQELIDAISTANSGDIIMINADIKLHTTLIIDKNLTLATENGSTISPDDDFETNKTLVIASPNKDKNDQLIDYKISKIEAPVQGDSFRYRPILIYVDCNSLAGLSADIAKDESEKKRPKDDPFNDLKTAASEFTLGLTIMNPGDPSYDENKVLKINGGGKCRAIYQDKGTLIVNSASVTNGFHERNGAGLFITNSADLVMNGGEVKDNHIDPNSTPLDKNGNMYENPKWHYKYSKTVLKFSADVWCSTATVATINGGYIGKLFQNEDDRYVGKTILNNGGEIGEVYVCNDSVRDTNNERAVFEFNGGTVGHVYLATSGNAGNVEASYEYTEVMNPTKGGKYMSASQEAQVGPYGFEKLQDAIDYAKDGDVIIIHKDITISSIPPIEKDITFRMAEKYVKPAKAGDDFTSSPFVMTQPENLKYSVRIELNGGGVTVPAGWTDNGGILSKNYEYGTALSDIIAEFGEAPARVGYKFVSWSYADGALGSVSSKIAVVYEAEDYDIDLHHGVKGFSHGKAKATFDGSSVSIHEAPVKIGHRLVGFSTHESGGTMVLNADGTFASHNVDDYVTDGKWSKSAHTTLYAQWEPDESPGKGYLIEIVAMCALEALIVIGIAVIVRRR